MLEGNHLMVVYSVEIDIETEEENQIFDITLNVRNAIKESGIMKGLVNAFVPGATGAITTMEYEPRLVEDTINLLNKLVPKGTGYQHDYQDDNAHSHIRASMLSPEITVPVINGAPALGTWQQIVFMEFDTRGRERKLIITVIGDKK
ncbi:MAG: YjbQ family protein [Asgard group archaeon]|nr:YjbQ family protein [Asgard group archaeon]